MPGVCKICGGPLGFAFDARDENRHCSDEVFRYCRCGKCGSYGLANVPADLAAYYPADYYALPTTLAEADLSTSGEEYKLAAVTRHVAGGRLLEVGPGAGMFLHLAAKRGFNVEAIEMSSQSACFISKVLGLKVHHAADEIAALERCEPFDVIALWHVIEHLRDPLALLRAAAQKLKPGGVLVIASPNPRALQFRLLGSRWAHLDAPRHLYLIASEALEEQAVPLGLERVSLTTSDEGARYWNAFGWEISVGNVLRPLFGQRAARRLGRLVHRCLRHSEQREGAGSAYTVVFRKA